jgi:peptidoglycan/LPS O-acetylase OafA/YrhL
MFAELTPTMNVHSIWPYFACMVFVLVIASTPLFKAADVPPNPRGLRISTLDGLRGFLALGVFFYHGTLYHDYLSDGRWVGASRFYSVLASAGVGTFFMITGYLFWSRVVAEKGRPDWLQLYIGRVFRIGPLYLFAVVSMLVIIFVRLGPHLNVPALQLVKELIRWFSLGFLGIHDINGYPQTYLLLAGVTWTLKFEWYFYISLPLLALAARSGRLHLPFAAGALMISLVYATIQPSASLPSNAILVTLFLVGMTCGSLAHNSMTPKLAEPLGSVIVGILVCAVFISFDSSYTAGATVLLGCAFFLIASGCSFFGVLMSRPARRLGDVSYGIYLLHGLVLTLVFSVEWARELSLGSPLGHWSMILLCAVLLVLVATFTHVWVERTGIELGRRLGRALRRGKVRAAALESNQGLLSEAPSRRWAGRRG